MARPSQAGKPALKIFAVNAGRDMHEFEVEANDYEVTAEGVHFITQHGAVADYVIAFVSHPCIVREDDGTIAAKRAALAGAA